VVVRVRRTAAANRAPPVMLRGDRFHEAGASHWNMRRGLG
jgi:hypothetical protein